MESSVRRCTNFEEDLFSDVEVIESQIALLDKIRQQKIAEPEIPVTPAAKVVIDYFKQRLVPQFFFSASPDVWVCLTTSVDSAPNLSIGDVVVCLLPAPEAPFDYLTTKWFSVTNARPERKAQVRMDHVARRTSTMVVTVYEGWAVGTPGDEDYRCTLSHTAGTVTIDILGICQAHLAREMFLSLRRWDTEPGKRVLSFLPAGDLDKLSTPALMPPVDDADEEDLDL